MWKGSLKKKAESKTIQLSISTYLKAPWRNFLPISGICIVS
jgi:hypothetical protein